MGWPTAKRCLLGLVVACATQLHAEAIQAPTGSDPEEVVLDGSKNPDIFPEWFVWEHTLQWVGGAGAAGTRPVPLRQELGVSRTELTFLLEEVRKLKLLQVILASQLSETRTAEHGKGKSEEQIRDATETVNLAYRYKILEARQRIYDRLSPASLIRLRSWMSEIMKGTTVQLRGRAIKAFRYPW